MTQAIFSSVTSDIYSDSDRYMRLRELLPQGNDHLGYFGPSSISWKIYKEPIILLGGLRAILMQLAHPAVAQGVADHSEFKKNVVRRTASTVRAMYSLVYGTKESAKRTASRIFEIHHRVHGVVYCPGTLWHLEPYRANDPELLRWVSITTLDTAILMYNKLVDELTDDQLAEFISDHNLALILGGVGLEYGFSSYEEVQDYIDINLAYSCISPSSMDLADYLLDHVLTRAVRNFTLGLLPPQLRKSYQRPWTQGDQERFAKSSKLFSRLNALSPSVPQYITAQSRLSGL